MDLEWNHSKIHFSTLLTTALVLDLGFQEIKTVKKMGMSDTGRILRNTSTAQSRDNTLVGVSILGTNIYDH